MTSLPKPNLPKPDTRAEAAQSPDRVREWVLGEISPFFLDAAADDPVRARHAARQMLVCHNAVNAKELQLAAQTAAFGMASLDCLRCSMSERDLPVAALLRMQSNAVTLSSMAESSREALEARQQRRPALTLETAQLDEAEFQAAIGKARQMVAFARTKLEAHRISNALVSGAQVKNVTRSPRKEPVLAPRLVEPIAPDVMARRKLAIRLWAKTLADPTHLDGLTRH